MRGIFTFAASLSVTNSLVLCVGVVVAFYGDNPELLRRMGTIVVAVTGLFVIWQVREEIRLEEIRHQLEEDHTNPAVPADQMLPLERTVTRLREADRRRLEENVTTRRLQIVGLIAVWLSAGELLHGFGDWFLEYSLRVWHFAAKH